MEGWEIDRLSKDWHVWKNVVTACDKGWEPFAVDSEYVYLKRRKEPEIDPGPAYTETAHALLQYE
jgi:hypothetical protein